MIYQSYMQRHSMEETLMHCAFAMSARGTCERAFVGAVFALEGRIISSGYNGAPAGMPHCEHLNYTFGSTPYEHSLPVPDWVIKWLNDTDTLTEACGVGDTLNYDNGAYTYTFHGFEQDLSACKLARHAEENAIVFAARHGISLKDSTLYITMLPCQECVPLVIGSGAVKVVAAERRKNPAGEELLRAAGVEIMVLVDTPEVGTVGQ